MPENRSLDDRAGASWVVPVAGAGGSSKTIDVTMTVTAAAGRTSAAAWQNIAFAPQVGSFTAQFDVVPNGANIDALTSLSAAPIVDYTGGAATVRFNTNGTIDVRNGGTYAADVALPYTATKRYHIRLVVNLPARVYSVYVTPDGGSETALAGNYAFRTEQAQTTQLANWGLYADIGSHTVTNFQIGAASLTANAGGKKAIAAGDSTTLSGTCAGGTGPYTYTWSPATGLSSTTGPTVTAAPSATTTYTLTVRDAVGNTAADTATVTVSGSAGPTYYVSPAGNDAASGSSSAPWKTLTKAANTVTAGATVLVQNGTYYETLRPASSGTAAAPITFRSATPGGAILDGQKSRGTVDMSRPASYIRVEGFEIRNSSTDGVFIQDYYTRNTRSIQIVNCHLHDNAGDAINFRNSIDSLVEGCDIHDNGLTAVAMGGQYGSTNLTIRRTRIHHNIKDGIQGQCVGLLAEYNSLYDQFHTNAHQDAFDIGILKNSTIRYNTISDFTQLVYAPIGDEAPNGWDGVQIYGNVFYNYRYWTVGGSSGPGGTCPGIFLGGGKTSNFIRNIQIFNNTFGYLGDGQKAILIYGAAGAVQDNIRIYNNIFYNCRGGVGDAMDFSANTTNLVSDYNCFYVVKPKDGQDAHSIQADPQFVNYSPFAAWDFRLKASSPCINRGDPSLASHVTVPSPFVDIDGTSRPAGGAYDIGAYESP